MKYDAIFFDFDGVIVDSVHIKTQVFYEMYLPYGKNIAKKAKQHHIENGGVSRFEKFKVYHKDFLGKTLNNDELITNNDTAEEEVAGWEIRRGDPKLEQNFYSG